MSRGCDTTSFQLGLKSENFGWDGLQNDAEECICRSYRVKNVDAGANICGQKKTETKPSSCHRLTYCSHEMPPPQQHQSKVWLQANLTWQTVSYDLVHWFETQKYRKLAINAWALVKSNLLKSNENGLFVAQQLEKRTFCGLQYNNKRGFLTRAEKSINFSLP